MSTFCYKTEGSQEIVNDMTTSSGNDIFKHENGTYISAAYNRLIFMSFAMIEINNEG